jgi:hypothetical protein
LYHHGDVVGSAAEFYPYLSMDADADIDIEIDCSDERIK